MDSNSSMTASLNVPSTKNCNIHIPINSLGHDTDRTGRLHKRWIISMVSVTENDLIPLTSNQTCCDKATFSVCNVQCKDNVSGRSFRFQKTPVPLTSMTSKSPFPIHANPIASPRSEKKKKVSHKFPSDASLWVSANEILNIFQRRLFSPRMSPSVTLSLFILFSWA